MLSPVSFLAPALEELRPEFSWSQTFEIDPAYAPLYTLEGLPEGAVAAAPEPATWAMMAVGFGLIGGLMWYRRGFAPASRLDCMSAE